MNIRYKVYYRTKEQVEANEIYPVSWTDTLPYKKIRASSEAKAIEIFRQKHPDLIPFLASLY